MKEKLTLEVFFVWQVIVHHKFILECEIQLPIHLQKAICLKDPKMWAAEDKLLMHVSDMTCWLSFVHQQLSSHVTFVLPHPPYFHDLTVCDFYLFLSIDWLKGCHFKDVVDVSHSFIDCIT